MSIKILSGHLRNLQEENITKKIKTNVSISFEYEHIWDSPIKIFHLKTKFRYHAMYVHILNFLGNMPRNTFFNGYITTYASSPVTI